MLKKAVQRIFLRYTADGQSYFVRIIFRIMEGVLCFHNTPISFLCQSVGHSVTSVLNGVPSISCG